MSTLARGAAMQWQVVHALILRETRTRFGAHQLGYLWALFQSLLLIGTFWGMFALLGRSAPEGMTMMGFLATGFCTYALWKDPTNAASSALSANRSLLTYPQVRPLDLVIARTALEMATTVTVFLIIMGMDALITQTPVQVDSALRVMTAGLLAALLGFSLGLCLCSLTIYSKTVSRLTGPLFRPMFWVSGLFYSANSLPSDARELLLWNPVLHAIELARDGWYPTYTARHADPFYIVAWIVPLMFAGLILERRSRRRLELT